MPGVCSFPDHTLLPRRPQIRPVGSVRSSRPCTDSRSSVPPRRPPRSLRMADDARAECTCGSSRGPMRGGPDPTTRGASAERIRGRPPRRNVRARARRDYKTRALRARDPRSKRRGVFCAARQPSTEGRAAQPNTTDHHPRREVLIKLPAARLYTRVFLDNRSRAQRADAAAPLVVRAHDNRRRAPRSRRLRTRLSAVFMSALASTSAPRASRRTRTRQMRIRGSKTPYCA